MSIYFYILIFIVVLLFVVGTIIFLQAKKVFREQKNYERGLKMICLNIHLPPQSDDIEAGGRDERDVNEETISKAETIYNILASAVPKKSFKNNFYGQKHISFEIVSKNNFINFYAMVPISMLEVVKQAILGAYPLASLTEEKDVNIFNQTSSSANITGGEMSLKKSFSYPIAVYQEIKRDPMLPILNALSSFAKTDSASIQILLRPTMSAWSKTSHNLSSKKRKGTDKKTGFIDYLKLILVAFTKPPEDNSKSENHTLSSLDQSVVDAIDDKTRYPGFEVLIRLIVSSNSLQRSQDILNNIVANFSIYDSPSKNGFKFKKTDNVERLLNEYIMRFFSQSNNEVILNSVELATLFHFPNQKSTPNSQVQRQDFRQVDGPPNLPENGLLLGINEFRNTRKYVKLSLTDRQRHLYAIGQTGVGKSVFLENLALQDMMYGNGFAFVDPHGDTVEKLLSMTPAERAEDVIYFSPADMERPMGFNLFEFQNEDQKDFIIQESINMLYKLYDPQHTGIVGPRLEHFFRMAALTIMADPAGGSFIDIPKLFRDNNYLEYKLKFVDDLTVLDFWRKEIPSSQRSNEFGEVIAWVTSKFSAFLSNTMMRNIIGQTKSAFDIRYIMDNNKILLVNLNRMRLGAINSQLLGIILIMKFQQAAMSRTDIPESERKDFCLFVDEFQNFSTDSFADIMSEARKYHLNLIVANQYITQLSEEIKGAVFGNVGTVVSFRVGQEDAQFLGEYFKPNFKPEDLIRIPNYNMILRTLINGVPTQPFSMVGLPTIGNPKPKLTEALKQLSALKYGRDRKEVEEEFDKRMTPQTKPSTTLSDFLNQQERDNFSNLKTQTNPFKPDSVGPVNQKLNSNLSDQEIDQLKGGSFLDTWLHKKNKQQNIKTALKNPINSHQPVEDNFDSALGTSFSSQTQIAPNENKQTQEQVFKINQDLNHNISSNEIDQEEIKEVSNILKKDLNDSTTDLKIDNSNLSDRPLDQSTEIIIDKNGQINTNTKDV